MHSYSFANTVNGGNNDFSTFSYSDLVLHVPITKDNLKFNFYANLLMLGKIKRFHNWIYLFVISF